MISVRRVELEKSKKDDTGGCHRHPRVQKQDLVTGRNVSSDIPATFYGNRRHLDVIFRKSPKIIII